jgi:hypothetical protein
VWLCDGKQHYYERRNDDGQRERSQRADELEANRSDRVPGGTRVLNTADGEPGWIVNGFSFDPDHGGCTEYEVETEYGIERWKRTDFILFSEFEQTD